MTSATAGTLRNAPSRSTRPGRSFPVSGRHDASSVMEHSRVWDSIGRNLGIDTSRLTTPAQWVGPDGPWIELSFCDLLGIYSWSPRWRGVFPPVDLHRAYCPGSITEFVVVEQRAVCETRFRSGIQTGSKDKLSWRESRRLRGWKLDSKCLCPCIPAHASADYAPSPHDASGTREAFHMVSTRTIIRLSPIKIADHSPSTSVNSTNPVRIDQTA